MSSIQVYEANRGTRNEAETGALILEHARAHLLDGLDAAMGNVELADIQAGIVLLNLSLLVFPEQEPKIKGVVPCPSLR